MEIRDAVFKYCVYYPVVFLRREHVPSYLRELMRTQWASPESIRALQVDKLSRIVAYAKSRVPYYEGRLGKVQESDLHSVDGIKALPFLTKDILRSEPRALVNRESFLRCTKKTTSGSTGRSVTVWKTPDAMGQELAAAWRGFSWAGIDIGNRQGRFWGVPFATKDRARARLIDFVTHRKRCSAFGFDEEQMQDYTRILNAFRPAYLYGYVSMLAAYGRFLEKTGTTLASPLRCIITTAELLTSQQKHLLESQFGCRVFNEYGCGEVGVIASQCEAGSLHVNSENLLVEILDGDRPCCAGEVGEVVVTELNNRAMPLIRYRLGDFAALSEKPCPCRRGLPVLEQVMGRAYDLVYNRDGRMFHGEYFMYIFEEVKRRNLGVAAFQIVQLDYDSIRVRVQPEPTYGGETEALIRDRIRTMYSPTANVEFELVDGIKREPSGKMRLVVGMTNRPLVSTSAGRCPGPRTRV